MSTTRKIILGLSLLAFALIVAAAITMSIEDRTEPKSQSELTFDGTRVFLETYKSQRGDIDLVQALRLTDSGIQMCHLLDRGFSLPQAFDEGVTSGMSSDMTVSVIESGIAGFCPKYSDLVTSRN